MAPQGTKRKVPKAAVIIELSDDEDNFNTQTPKLAKKPRLGQPSGPIVDQAGSSHTKVKVKHEAEMPLAKVPRYIGTRSDHIGPRDHNGEATAAKDAAIQEVRAIAESTGQRVGDLETMHEDTLTKVTAQGRKLEDKLAETTEVNNKKIHDLQANFESHSTRQSEDMKSFQSRIMDEMTARFNSFSEQLASLHGLSPNVGLNVVSDSNIGSRWSAMVSGSDGLRLNQPAASTRNEDSVRGSIRDDSKAESVRAETAITTSSTTRALVDPMTRLGVLPVSYTTQARLTGPGYHELLLKFDFSDLEKLEALAQVDNLENLREYALFCDKSRTYTHVTYIVMIGGNTYSIMDGAPAVTWRHLPSLQDADLTDLRLFQLELVDTDLDKEQLDELAAWKKANNPPRYCYELGSVFLRRDFKHKTKEDIISTCFSLVIDVVDPNKSVWVIVRPGWAADARQHRRNKGESDVPFAGMTNSMIACVMRDFCNLSLASDSDGTSGLVRYSNAERVVKETACSLPVETRAKSVDLMEMKAFIDSTRQQG